jgi:hypothetical protein
MPRHHQTLGSIIRFPGRPRGALCESLVVVRDASYAFDVGLRECQRRERTQEFVVPQGRQAAQCGMMGEGGHEQIPWQDSGLP